MSPRVSVRVITTISAAQLLAGPALVKTGEVPRALLRERLVDAGVLRARFAGRTTTTLPSTTTPNGTPNTTTRGRSILTGRVMTEEGGPPPDTVSIERVSSGFDKAEGYTDSKGYFAIESERKERIPGCQRDRQLQTPEPLGNISGPGSAVVRRGTPRGVPPKALRDLRSSRAAVGYRSQTVSLANRRPIDDPNIGIILLHREGHDEGRPSAQFPWPLPATPATL